MKTIIFGCGKGFSDLLDHGPKMEIVAIADNKKFGGEIEIDDNLIKIITPEEIKDYSYDKIVISTNTFRFEILEQLIALGVNEEKIKFYCPTWSLFETISIANESDKLLLDVKQKDGIRYSWRDAVEERVSTWPIEHNEYEYECTLDNSVVVIDVGMNVGISVLWFANKKNVEAVYGYELFEPIYMQAKYNLNKNPHISKKVKMYNYGLGDGDKKINGVYYEEHCTASRMTEEENPKWESVHVTVDVKDAGTELKSILKEDDKIYVLKMNCEGAEYEIVPSLIRSDVLKQVDVLLIETHDGREEEMFALLKNSGFVKYYFANLLFFIMQRSL